MVQSDIKLLTNASHQRYGRLLWERDITSEKFRDIAKASEAEYNSQHNLKTPDV